MASTIHVHTIGVDRYSAKTIADLFALSRYRWSDAACSWRLPMRVASCIDIGRQNGHVPAMSAQRLLDLLNRVCPIAGN